MSVINRMSNRVSSQIKKVAFGNSFAFKIESNFLKAEIAKGVLGSLLPFDDDVEAFHALKSQFPKEPIDGFLDVAFEWILRYTYVQHNYLLFCYTIPELFDCTDIPTAIVLGRRCTVMINKYTQDMYLVSFRFSHEMFDGTVFDGILLKDNCIFPDYFENTYQSSMDWIDSPVPEDLQEEYCKHVSKYVQSKTEGEPYSFNPQRERYFRDQPEWHLHYVLGFPTDVISVFTQYFEPYRNQIDEDENEEESAPKEKIEETELKVVWENYKEITQTIDFSDVYKQRKLPGMYIFHIQAVYRMFGDRMPHSPQKLVDAISYNSLLAVQTRILQSNEYYVKDEWIEPFVLKNSIDTMYYTRHTQVDLRNPYHNDYLRYHPRCDPDDEMNENECEYKHFIPETTENAEDWNQIYKLSKEMVLCELQRTKFPYVYSLSSHDPRVQEHDYAKVYTLEGRRYIRVITNKIHADRTRPLMIKCRPVIQRDNNEIVGWMPVKYDTH